MVHVPLWIEAIGPAPAGQQIGLVPLKNLSEVRNVLFAPGGIVRGKAKVRSHPGEVDRRQRAEQVRLVQRA